MYTTKFLVMVASAVALAAGVAGTAVSRDASESSASEQSTYETTVTATDGTTWTEWIASSGAWRMQAPNGSTKVFDLRGYASFEPGQGSYARIGSGRFLGYLTDAPISQVAVRQFTGAGQSPNVRRVETERGLAAYNVDRGGQRFRVIIERGITAEAARDRGLFIVDTRGSAVVARERPVGSQPTLPVRAYWFSRNVAGRSAVLAMEYSRSLTAEELAMGMSTRKESTAYVVFYERPTADGATSAEPGRTPPTGELQVVNQPIRSASAQAAIAAFNGVNGDETYTPWPRFGITLSSGERATVVLDLAEGSRLAPNGERAYGAFSIITRETLVSVTGTLTEGDIRAIMRELEALSR